MDNIQYTSKEGNPIIFPVYSGWTIDIMPELIAQGYKPISVAEVMQQRIKAWQSRDKELAKLWGNNYFDSGDSIIYHPDGRIKVVCDSQTLRCVNANTSLRGFDSQVLPCGTFDKVQGEEFTRKDIEKYTGKSLKQNEVLENPIWLALARGDKGLLREYVGQIHSRINNPELMMRIWVVLYKKKSNFEAENLWCIFDINCDSSVYGDNHYGRLNKCDGRLVGVAPKIEEKLSKIEPVSNLNLENLVLDLKKLKESGDLPLNIEEVLNKYNI